MEGKPLFKLSGSLEAEILGNVRQVKNGPKRSECRGKSGTAFTGTDSSLEIVVRQVECARNQQLNCSDESNSPTRFHLH